MRLDIIFEDEYMIAVVKPAGVSSQQDRGVGEDLYTAVQNYLFDQKQKDMASRRNVDATEQSGIDEEIEEPYLAVINRLDRPVGGIVLFAKDEKIAAELSDMIQDRDIDKYYQAVVTGTFEDFEGEFEDYILVDKKTNTSKIVPAGTKGAKKAVLEYEVLDELDMDEGPMALVLIHLLTGRHHQIRCQMAYHKLPLWGDTKYNPKFQNAGNAGGKNGQGQNGKGGKNAAAGKNAKYGKGKFGKGQNGKGGKGAGQDAPRFTSVGLYSTRMEFEHPVTGELVTLHREPEGQAFEMIDQMDF